MNTQTLKEIYEVYLEKTMNLHVLDVPDFEDWLFDNGYLEDDDEI